jgi:hypothetical protein
VSGARSKAVKAASVSLAVVIGVTGCGAAKQLAGKQSAKQDVTNALSSFGDAKSVAFTVSVDTSVADVAAISKAQGDPMSKSDQASLAKFIASDVVVNIVAPAGKTLGDAGKTGSTQSSDLTTLLGDPAKLDALLKSEGSSSVQVEDAGASLFELRSVAGVIYVKADVKRILTLAGQNPAQLDQALSSLPPSMSSIGKAAKGEWVSLDLAKAAAAAKDSGLLKSIPTPAPSATVDAAKMQKLLADLKTAYSQKATITNLGDDATKGTGYRLGAPAKQVALAVEPDLVALVGKSGAKEVKKGIAQIPDKTFNLDLWVKDDKLTDVSLDLTQFFKKPVVGKKLSVNVAVDVDGGKVEAPAGASEIDVKSLLSQIPAGALSGGLGGLGGLGGVTPGSADTSSGSGVATPKLTKAQRAQLKASGMTDAQIDQLLGKK